MLLNLLSKEEKIKFLDLVIKVITTDGDVSETEKLIISKFKNEMGEDVLKFHASNNQLEKLVEYFSTKPSTTKNLVYYNLISASLSDEFYSVEEHFTIASIQEKLGISNKKRTELIKAVYAERDMREKVKRVITD